MSTEHNKAIVRRWHEDVWNRGDLELIDELCADTFVCHFIAGEEWHGREGIRREITSLRTSFPDWTEYIEDIVAEGDRVVTRYTSRGTHLGAFLGKSPTGKRVAIAEVSIYRLIDGVLVEQWCFPDAVDMQRQLGT